MRRPVILKLFGRGSAAILAWTFLLHAAHAVTFEIADPAEFSRIINTNSLLTTNATINSWIEGPVWVPSGGYLVFSDIGNNLLKKLAPPYAVTDFRTPPANTKCNGNLLDWNERLISCEAGSAGLRLVLFTNGVATPLVTNHHGKKFYSPNDLAVKSDGSIWFTDPGYDSGLPLPPPIGGSVPAGFQPGLYVYYFYETNGDATCAAVITNGLRRPNGICLSPDETKLFVADSDGSRNRIHVYAISPSNTLSGGAVFANISNGAPDGIRCDVDGRVWSSAGNGVHIFAPDGHLIGKILFMRTANLCFGGPQYKTLYMTGQPLLTSIPVLVAGIPSLKKLRATSGNGQLNLSWPAPSTGFALQETDEATSPASWTNSPLAVSTSNNQRLVNVDTTNTSKFFRLRLN